MTRMKSLNRNLPLEDREDHVLNRDNDHVPQAVETNPTRGVVA